MSIIKDLFSKDIDRDIQGVIKVGQSDAENKRQELDEYVVTRELSKHFSTFYTNYMKGITGTTDKVGVWISGFFGSGKSHFLKILSYLLSNEEVDGKTPYQYFVDGDKIADEFVLANMKKASEISSDVILFNIDAKGKKNESLAVTFLKVFNEHLGYYADNPYIADLERDMDKNGTYTEFKDNFAKIHGQSWEEGRIRSDFIRDDMVKALIKAKVMSEAAARGWYLGVAKEYDITIRNFALLVKEYINSQGRRHQVLFLVDEVGQYIGENVNLMLNLQTITEELGSQCLGKAWVIVTSQQNVDEVVKVKGDDFSKIQGRFDTRLSLSSAHADEVIRKRLLDKNEHSGKMLEGLYEENRTMIRNLILFKDSGEQKLYHDGENFAADYPFVPYQFNLVASALSSIRIHGAVGKHLSEGERSMLSLFQDSAVHLKDRSIGALVPFNIYYEPLAQFIDHSHSAVVIKAKDNRNLADDTEDTSFAVEVLKVLFLIKYVDGFKANLQNITSLMVSHIDEDRIELQKKIEVALGKLVSETLIQKNADIYVFLTNEEQEINRAISTQSIERDIVYKALGQAVSEEILKTNKYVYPNLNNQYIFSYKVSVDDHTVISRTNSELALRVVTPWYELGGKTALRQLSQENKEVVFELSGETAFLEEIQNYLKIEKFLNTSESRNTRDHESIRGKKDEERTNSKNRSLAMLEEALRHASAYVNGSKQDLKQTDISAKVNESMSLLLSEIYLKLHYIETVKTKADIKELLMNRDKAPQIRLAGSVGDNNLAKTEVKDYLSRISSQGPITLKTLKNTFQKPPYGYKEDDVIWLATSLFLDEDISYNINGEEQDSSSDAEQLYNSITKSSFDERVTVVNRKHASSQNKTLVHDILRELFNQSKNIEKDDALKKQYDRVAKTLAEDLERHLENYKNNKHFTRFPGEDVLRSGAKTLRDTLSLGNTFYFFAQFREYHDDLLEFQKDFEDLKEFLGNEKQKKLYAQSVKYFGFYQDNETFISNPDLTEVATEVENILEMTEPYKRIYLLEQHNKTLVSLLMKQFEEASKIPLQQVEGERKRVVERLEEMKFNQKDSFEKRVNTTFDELRKKIEHSHSSAEINGVSEEARTLCAKFYRELDGIHNEIVEQAKIQQKQKEQENRRIPEEEEIVVPKIRKNVSIREVTAAHHWRVETENDIDAYLKALRRELVSKLEENTIIEIEL